jgi:hypothetical protein
VNVRLASNKNTVVKLSDAFKKELQNTFALNNAVDMLRYREGHSMDAIYGLTSIGVDPATGMRVFKSIDGELTFDQHPNDLVYLGDRQPKANGTISLHINWKGFRLNANFMTKLGGMIENSSELRAENVSMAGNIDRRVLTDKWKKPGDIARYKNILIERGSYTSNMFVHRENMLNGGSINLEYVLPQSIVSKLGVQHLSIGADLADMFYLSTIKRERGLSYPFSRNPNFRINLTF